VAITPARQEKAATRAAVKTVRNLLPCGWHGMSLSTIHHKIEITANYFQL
jgi:hypothetical protein